MGLWALFPVFGFWGTSYPIFGWRSISRLAAAAVGNVGGTGYVASRPERADGGRVDAGGLLWGLSRMKVQRPDVNILSMVSPPQPRWRHPLTQDVGWAMDKNLYPFVR